MLYPTYFKKKIFFFNNFFIKNFKKNLFKNIINFFFLYKFNKLRYFGKTYRIIFKKNCLIFKVGRSHKTILNYNNYYYKVLKKKKNKYFFKTSCYFMKKFIKLVYKARKPNLYTKRGLKISKVKIKKRFGKVSQAFMGLH